MLAVTVAVACPNCTRGLVSTQGAAPWCPDCEYGLGELEPDVAGIFGWRWIDRRLFRLAYRMTRAEFRKLDGAPDVPVGRTSLVVTAAAVLIYLFLFACVVVGVWLCTLSFPGFGLVFGLGLILFAVLARPRFGRVPRDETVLEPGEAPHLRALVARVAEAVGAREPHVIRVEEDEFNASAGVYGLRRRRVLTIGLPLWLALSPQQRVALLGHEMGHFVNGDPRRGLFVQPIYGSLGVLADVLTPVRDREVAFTGAGWIARMAEIIMAPLGWLVRGVQLGLVVLAQREGQRAEYRADVLAARSAGSQAAADLMNVFLLHDTITMLIKRDARAGVLVGDWPATTAEALRKAGPNLAMRRQLSVRRETGLFVSHPPAGLRARLIEARPAEPAAVVLDTATNALVEQDLARYAARAARTLKSL
jgi:Zn-dependent protease with chaperone function